MTAAPFPATLAPVKRISLTRRYLRRPVGMVALAVFALIVVAAVFAPWLAPYDPNLVEFTLAHAVPGNGHLLGGDSAGRDILSRLLYGARTTLYGAVITCGTGVLLGVPAGIVAGYFGGVTDRVCSWISDALQSVPGMVVLLVVAAGTGQDFTVLMVALGVFLAPGYYRITRARALAVRKEPYIDAARVAGVGTPRILRTHLLRAVYAPIIVQTALTAGVAIGMQAGLQFLGIGSASTPSWGQTMNDGFQTMLTYPLILLWPSIALGITIAALAFIGSTLADLVSVRAELPTRRARVEVRAALAAGDLPGGVASGTAVHATAECALRIENLRVGYATGNGVKEVVRGVSLDAAPGEVLGIVGESGSGKTQTVFSVLDLLPPGGTAVADGIWVGGREVGKPGERAKLLGREIGYVPQEPMTNLDPCYPIGHQLVEPLRHVHGLDRTAARERAREVLVRVGITDPDRVLASYPHQISGGMAQRVLIAGAVAGRPSLLVADEPTTALDVTVQAEVLELLRELQAEYGMALVIVTHNFGVVADICDRVVVMKDGRIVETGPVDRIFRAPEHPYTAELISASLDDSEGRDALDEAWHRQLAVSGKEGAR
ncbi:dipeptide/oligopeptide/nickel ABC transporter permease/ATP-binding protein [Amycolatopsis jejuensis]|uniref:dipeptide/oligopeptide/nickel ABC transporter permease/ATP-binding protein n=1 Tax=Amycolatopsis jejuensis TaxID=330084 RepID=UPI0005246686|nr:dipeptide/oligopeptide/nickel ABC transporter permease/ATP-binding protein [Amycolatopsis jejuensis]